MEYREYLEMGFDSIRQHKMRSLLTMLGVIFGVSAVIAMMSIAGGARKAALDQIKLLGTNNIRIQHLSLTEEQQQEAEEFLGQRVPEGLLDAFVDLPEGAHWGSVGTVNQPQSYRSPLRGL